MDGHTHWVSAQTQQSQESLRARSGCAPRKFSPRRLKLTSPHIVKGIACCSLRALYIPDIPSVLDQTGCITGYSVRVPDPWLAVCPC